MPRNQRATNYLVINSRAVHTFIIQLVSTKLTMANGESTGHDATEASRKYVRQDVCQSLTLMMDAVRSINSQTRRSVALTIATILGHATMLSQMEQEVFFSRRRRIHHEPLLARRQRNTQSGWILLLANNEHQPGDGASPWSRSRVAGVLVL
jgi:hypothetical protein